MANASSAAAPVRVDFREAPEAARWSPTHDVAAIQHSAEGMEINIAGPDPYITGPAFDLPTDLPPDSTLLLELRLKADQGGFVEVFHFPDGGGAVPARSVSTRVQAGEWQLVRLPLPPLERRFRLRLDPPGTGGKTVIASLSLRPRLRMPPWPAQQLPAVGDPSPHVVRSGDVVLRHDGTNPGGFEVSSGDNRVAVGMTRQLVGYSIDGEARWAEMALTAAVKTDGGTVLESFAFPDSDGGQWRIERRYAPGDAAGAIDVETRVTVDRDRDVLFLPAFVVLPGVGSFGADKSQAVFPGLEYLDRNEPSSSEADVTTPASKRRVPESSKVTFPLMAVCGGGRYVGLVWNRSPTFSPLFDSPDRSFGAGGHAMGLVFPGDEPRRGADGELLPDAPQRLAAGQTVTVRATLIGGTGDTVLPAIRQYVSLRGLPPVPDLGMDARGYDALAAAGWLDSKIREGGLVRHAVWPGFGAGHAPDAAVWMRWLEARTQPHDPQLAARLRRGADEVIAAVPADRYDTAHVGHITYPALASLVFGRVEENARAAEEHGRRLLRRFESDGTAHYRAEPGKSDFARTHSSRDANGFAAPLVVQALRAGAVSGDAELLQEGLRLLRALDRYDGTVPRGAQSWEVPLHTPDVLASAQLVRAYTLGYELTGDAELLRRAKDWAWTGVPFVYLDNPTGQPVGPYATIPVFGASHWIDVWFGRPVQWCGLAYADALYGLRRHDPAGPWGRLAAGITASGIQQSWPTSDAERQGLLPDFFHLAPQTRDGPAINPATVQACDARLFKAPEPYGLHCFRRHGLMVHVPGPVTEPAEDAGGVSFVAQGWPSSPYHVLVAGLKSLPQVRVDGKELPPGEHCRFVAGEGRLVLQVQGRPRVELRFAP